METPLYVIHVDVCSPWPKKSFAALHRKGMAIEQFEKGLKSGK